MRRLIVPLFCLGMFAGTFAFGQDEAGPMVLDASKAPKVVNESGAAPKVKIDPNMLGEIDVKKTPWLIESVGLSASHPALQRPKMLWADSWQSVEIPEIEVERWITEPPQDLAGKFVLLEVWATWCPPCRRSLPYLNFLQEKYGKDLVVIAICETDEDALKKMTEPIKLQDIQFHLAIDTGRRFANKLGVFGIPHAVILEPIYGAVLWEGMPTQPGHELSDKKIEKILAFREKLEQKGLLPKESPVKIVVSEPENRVQPPSRHAEEK